jgi:hypothetical protein
MEDLLFDSTRVHLGSILGHWAVEALHCSLFGS